MAASSSASRLKYDVFISFRGDTSNSFARQLYSELRENQIRAYIDEECLEKGDDISRALPNAIKESETSIIIISAHYASSRWCLDELVHILKRSEEKSQIVLPIFLGVDPSHVRHQKGTHDAAFNYQEYFKEKMDKVREWRRALNHVAHFPWWDFRGKSESVAVKDVVKAVIRRLQLIWSTGVTDSIQRQQQRRHRRILRQHHNMESARTHLQKAFLTRKQHFKCFSKWFEDLSMAASSSAVAVDPSPLKFDLSMAASSSAVAVDPSPLKFDLSMAASSSAVAVDPSPLKFDLSMAASSSAVDVDPSLLKYDVFISFRGETRNSFTSDLYFALCQKQIKPYIDQECLEKGDDISRALPKAIEESALSIIIFSKDFASSRWCLDELVHILKCKDEKDQIVLPIFYGIDPSHIRHQKETYAAAFVEHQECFKDEMEKVREWRQALTRAADLSGWDSRGKSEYVLVQQVVEDVIRKLESISSVSIDNLKGLFGISRQLCQIESLLCFDSPNVRTLGIWGMGGIGKTTLACVVFKCFTNRFEGTCFLESVREESKRKGLVELEKEVFSKLLGEKDCDVSNPFVNVRLSRKKALVVLDDVDDFVQLERLAGDRHRFGPGSKIIVTSRYKLKVDKEYKVEALGLNDARKLFYSNVFPDKSCRREYKEISDQVVEYTKGHPLALKVLGASVFNDCESIEDWEKELKKLKRVPNPKIQEVLKISFGALDAEEKGLFLDIACFFKGNRRDFVEGILEGKPIRGLVNKSLITIEDGRICMHDLIQEMGRDIVCQSTDNLGKRSRLWFAEDVSYVLENNKGTEAIEGIYLPWIEEELHLRPDVFEEMRKLRLLKIHPLLGVKVYIDGDLKYLPNRLRYLHWKDYPGKSLPSNFKPQNLVELHMPRSNLEQLWDGVQKLWSLKHINLQGSNFLTKIPDLSRAPKLESINISDCPSLIHIPSLNLQATLDESAYRHLWLTAERHDYELKAQSTPGCIILHCCVRLTTLPKVSGNIRKLVLNGTALKELPSSIESLENLLHLDLRECNNLKSLPKLPRSIEILLLDSSGIEQIPSLLIECLCCLRILSLSNCKSLSSLPSNIKLLKALEELCLIGTSIQALPSTTGMLYKLKKLDISNCKNLQSLLELPLFIEYVCAEGCSSLKMVSTLRSTHTLGRLLDKYDTDNYKMEFSFLNCTKLGEDAINNIIRELFCSATTPRRAIGELFLCYPSKEIPRWFRNQSEGSSIIITLPPPNRYNPKTFLGFFVSVVFSANKNLRERGSIDCFVSLETNCDESLEGDVFKYVFSVNSHLDSNHMFMGYKYFDHSKANFEKYQEAWLKFSSDCGRVERCGVRMIYLKDAVEESDDGTTASSDEPPPKRTRNL